MDDGLVCDSKDELRKIHGATSCKPRRSHSREVTSACSARLDWAARLRHHPVTQSDGLTSLLWHRISWNQLLETGWQCTSQV